MHTHGNLALHDRFAEPSAFFAHGLSHPGVVREENEDSWLTDTRLGLAMVADGVGGHGDGAWASQEATRLISRFIARVFQRWSGRGAESFQEPSLQERVVRRAI